MSLSLFNRFLAWRESRRLRAYRHRLRRSRV